MQSPSPGLEVLAIPASFGSFRAESIPQMNLAGTMLLTLVGRAVPARHSAVYSQSPQTEPVHHSVRGQFCCRTGPSPTTARWDTAPYRIRLHRCCLERVLKTAGRAELRLSREASHPFVSALRPRSRLRGMALRVAQGQNLFQNMDFGIPNGICQRMDGRRPGSCRQRLGRPW